VLRDGLAERIAARAGDLSPAEARVAAHFLDAGPEAALLSAAKLAERLGTSDATVVRTAQALGYEGLAELRRAIAGRSPEPPLAERLRHTLAESSREELLAASIANHLTALAALARRVTPDRFQQAVDILAQGSRVVWRGVGPSAHLAAYGGLLCQRVGHPSVTLTQTGTSFADEMLSLAASDAVVVLAYGRIQPHVRILLEHAATLGAPVVLVTDTLARRLADRVAVTLESGRGTPGLFASHGTTLVLIEALVLGLAGTNEQQAEDTLATLNDLRAALARHRIDVDRP
jgi:DNA-binding MurR/RpiR family transcriptional regulator